MCVYLMRKGKGSKISEAGLLRTPIFKTPSKHSSCVVTGSLDFNDFLVSLMMAILWGSFGGLPDGAVPPAPFTAMQSHLLNCIS